MCVFVFFMLPVLTYNQDFIKNYLMVSQFNYIKTKALRRITVLLTVVGKELLDSVVLGLAVKQCSTLHPWLCSARLEPYTNHLFGSTILRYRGGESYTTIHYISIQLIELDSVAYLL